MRHAPGGFTLIELVVVLTSIAVLALALSPAAISFVHDARVVRTRQDTEAIFLAIVRFSFDNGFFPQWTRANDGGPGTTADKIDILVGDGSVPVVADDNLWRHGTSDRLAHQLTSNTPGYAMRTALAFGWNGPYLYGGVAPDAWNHQYLVNIGLISAGSQVEAGDAATRYAVWVISAGPDGVLETPPMQPMTTAEASGDDIGVRVQ
ncbi:MAG: prepilin-type N-terminal cleavage/methylation domain-containing protein [Acidobacteria bacterium]|nr:prepilin-type N-terminal cleavage/methylation domain-containing protein [Acidobacteriota bacterium]